MPERSGGDPGLAGVLARAATRVVVAAMAMTGMRQVTVGLGLARQAPPEEIADHGLPHLFGALSEEHREAAIELAHWLYGAAAGAAFGALPRAARVHLWAGPLYGLATWAAFERVVAPLFGLREAEDRAVSERVVTAADHVLYGLVVAARPHDL